MTHPAYVAATHILQNLDRTGKLNDFIRSTGGSMYRTEKLNDFIRSAGGSMYRTGKLNDFIRSAGGSMYGYSCWNGSSLDCCYCPDL